MLKPVSILHASSGHFRMSPCDRGGHFPAQGGKGPSHAPAGDSLVSVLSLVAEPGYKSWLRVGIRCHGIGWKL